MTGSPNCTSGQERTGSHSIRYRARDMVEADSIREFIEEYRPDLTP